MTVEAMTVEGNDSRRQWKGLTMGQVFAMGAVPTLAIMIWSDFSICCTAVSTPSRRCCISCATKRKAGHGEGQCVTCGAKTSIGVKL